MQMDNSQIMSDCVYEPERKVGVSGSSDVVVCGGGPAGVAAAIAAARNGARTTLLELHGCLGGVWTSGMLSWILDHKNKSGIMQELLERLAENNGRVFSPGGIPSNGYDIEVMKLLLEQMCLEAGVQIQLHSRVCAAVKSRDNRMTHVIVESKSGREAFGGKVFLDCTGEGDLGAVAGCGFDYGSPETGAGQPMSMMALITGVTADGIGGLYRDVDAVPQTSIHKLRLKEEMEKAGISPSYAKPSIFRIYDDLYALMSNHEYEVKGFNAVDITEATMRARREINAQIDCLRASGGKWSGLRLVATAAQIGVREGRRLHGLYRVSAEDLREGREHADSACRVQFNIDIHSTDPARHKGIVAPPFTAKPYDIPMRALIARDVKGLMMAGRCISGDFVALSSYRVTGNAVAMGESAGRFAAACVAEGMMPHEKGGCGKKALPHN